MNIRFWAPALIAGLAFCSAAQAQRAGENVMASAKDAFGTTVGNESIGLYTARDVRGFDPVQAGNVRLEGLYFDRQSPGPSEIFVSRMVTSSAIRVGLSAQSYPFPAPSGLADVKLRIPGDKQVTSLFTGFGPYNKAWVEADSQLPVMQDKLSLGVGLGWMHDDTPYANRMIHWSGGLSAHFEPSDTVEIIPFWSGKYTHHHVGRPVIYTAGSFLPPEYTRHEFFLQHWALNDFQDANFGVIGNLGPWDDWTVRVGVFRSLLTRGFWSSSLFNNTQPNGVADYSIVAFPPQEFGSVSGEIRASRSWTFGDFRHTLHFAGRGRVVKRVFGGSSTVQLGKYTIGVPVTLPPQKFNFGAQTTDRVNQGTGGIAYDGIWAGVAEFSAGLQKTSYHRTLSLVNTPDNVIKDKPWLYNATAAYHVTDKIVLFGSYTNGLEESGEAPNNATNRGEALPASRTSQVDAGIRYSVTPDLNAVVTLFQIKKPYFNLNTAGLYTDVGDLSHRGLEFSLAGKLADGLTIVAGTVFLNAEISGDLVTRGVIGKKAVGRTPRVTRFNIEYGPKNWQGFSTDFQVENLSSRVSSLDNRAMIPARTTLSAGARYRFRLFDRSATLRFQAQNLTNVFGWDINAMQISYEPNEPRRFITSLAVDF
ncbi:MAG: TonB-dependent receptor [Rhodospirillaceae bacterium]|nr:TonB-dependent receptor [Rhodospirillaceae bacterium]